ncbi:MAG: aspartate carbamoyltransferase catalytic subunit [Gammaproteobacteria bacterium]|nr:aspartate carbamoyltransferase catalytic subunit [Gammaproteobacteria bacterium]MCH9763940.1 aspartate carbamoyltransferase catalytic subunit [Gammaproteobacteria bacterium]
MKYFLDVDTLTPDTAHALFERAFDLKQAQTYPQYHHISLLNLFYEESTRTRLSFDLAAKKLGISVLNLDPKRSSEAKGESMADMLQTIAAMGINILVMRHPDDDVFSRVVSTIPTELKLLNAGNGMLAHPTQAMLDIMTMLEQKIVLQDAKIVVVGDILHSRVAGSLQRLCALLGVKELVFTGPRAWLPDALEYGDMTDSLSDALEDADVVMTLRVQRERFTPEESLNFDAYRKQYAITEALLSHAKPNACVLHPGPMNRGVEIDSAVADGPQSCILKQVENGVFIRMAILEALIK